MNEKKFKKYLEIKGKIREMSNGLTELVTEDESPSKMYSSFSHVKDFEDNLNKVLTSFVLEQDIDIGLK